MNHLLMDLVRKFPEGSSSQEIHAALSRKETVVTDTTLHSYRELVRRFGAEFTESVLSKLETAGKTKALLRITFQALSSQGIDFSHAAVQDLIRQLQSSGVFTASEATALREIGVRTVSMLDRVGLSEVVLADVVQAVEDLRYRKEVLDPLIELYNTCSVLAERGELTAAVWEQHTSLVATGLRNWG